MSSPVGPRSVFRTESHPSYIFDGPFFYYLPFLKYRFLLVSGQDVEPLFPFAVHLAIQAVLLVVKQSQKLGLQFITFIFLATAGLTYKILALEQDETFVPE